MVFNIVVSYRCKRKMLKRTETEETIDFCHIFVIGEISIGGEPGPLPPSLATSLLQVKKTKKVFSNFPQGFRRFTTKFQLFEK